MKQIMIFLAIACAYISGAHGALTNSGHFSFEDSSAWADIMNASSGEVTGKHSKFLKLVNFGTVELNECMMMKDVESSGLLIAKGTKFFTDLNLGGGETTLTSCTLENIIVSTDANAEQPAKLTLNGTTTINGSVVFKTAPGTLYKGPGVVVHGEITNGTVIDLRE